MAFRVKNIKNFNVRIMGITLQPKAVINLKNSFTNAQIKTSLLNGELYRKLQGRMLAILDPRDFNSIALAGEQLSRLEHAGFVQGKLGEDDLKAPFLFDDFGNLLTSTARTVSATISGIVSVADSLIRPWNQTSYFAAVTTDIDFTTTIGGDGCFYVGTAGYIHYLDQNGNDGYVLSNSGAYHAIIVNTIYTDGTTATDITIGRYV